MTEAQLQDAVVTCAQVLGWRVAHFRPALTARGWRTAVSADGKGFPDLVLAREGRVLFAELKAERGHLSPEQIDWAVALQGTAVRHYVWRPADWLDGTVEMLLRGEDVVASKNLLRSVPAEVRVWEA